MLLSYIVSTHKIFEESIKINVESHVFIEHFRKLKNHIFKTNHVWFHYSGLTQIALDIKQTKRM